MRSQEQLQPITIGATGVIPLSAFRARTCSSRSVEGRSANAEFDEPGLEGTGVGMETIRARVDTDSGFLPRRLRSNQFPAVVQDSLAAICHTVLGSLKAGGAEGQLHAEAGITYAGEGPSQLVDLATLETESLTLASIDRCMLSQ